MQNISTINSKGKAISHSTAILVFVHQSVRAKALSGLSSSMFLPAAVYSFRLYGTHIRPWSVFKQGIHLPKLHSNWRKISRRIQGSATLDSSMGLPHGQKWSEV